jgi:hypothetical protein
MCAAIAIRAAETVGTVIIVMISKKRKIIMMKKAFRIFQIAYNATQPEIKTELYGFSKATTL